MGEVWYLDVNFLLQYRRLRANISALCTVWRVKICGEKATDRIPSWFHLYLCRAQSPACVAIIDSPLAMYETDSLQCEVFCTNTDFILKNRPYPTTVTTQFNNWIAFSTYKNYRNEHNQTNGKYDITRYFCEIYWTVCHIHLLTIIWKNLLQHWQSVQ